MPAPKPTASKPKPKLYRIRLDIPAELAPVFQDLAWQARSSRAAIARRLVMDWISDEMEKIGESEK